MAAEKKRIADRVQLALGPIIGIVVLLLTFTEGYQRLELVSYDWRFTLRNSVFGPPPMDPRLGTIDIDDASVEVEGRYNDWTRDKYADVIRILGEYEAEMVAFDVFFTEKSSRLIYEEQLRKLPQIDQASVEGLLQKADYDGLFRRTIEKADNVYLAYYTKKSPRPDPLDADAAAALETMRQRAPRLMVPVDQSPLAKINEFEPPLASFRQVARGFAPAQSIADVDGIRRRYPLVFQYEDMLIPALALVMVCDHLQVPITEVEVWPGDHIRLPAARLPEGPEDIEIPIDAKGNMRVNWAGQWRDTFTHYPHIALRDAAQREDRQKMLDTVKGLVAENPKMAGGRGLMGGLQAAGYTDAAANKGAILNYIFAAGIEAALQRDPTLEAGAFWASKGVKEPIAEQLETFERVKLTNEVADLLTEKPGLLLAEVQERLADAPATNIAQSYAFVRGHMEGGQIAAAARPLYFYPYITYQGGLLTPEVVKDKILVYGLTATGTHDLNVIPFQGDYPMVGIYPNVLNTILNRVFIEHAPHWIDAMLALIVGIGLSLTVPRLSIKYGLLLVVGAGVIYTSIAFLAFTHAGYWLELVGPLSTLGMGYLGLTIYGYVSSEREKRFVQGAFGHYLSPAVVDQIMENPDMVNQLGGEERVMTGFFSDIASFSTISERLTPAELVQFINDYLSEMCEIIEYYGGTIDKFEGDAIVAFFGAPVFYEDHAVRAVMACIDQQRKLIEVRERWRQEGALPPRLDALRQEWESKGRVFGHVRMGLAAGPMVVGNLGSKTRNDYTMMGDTVNLAARFESGGKFYGTSVMVNDLIWDEVKDLVEGRLLDKIQVMGKEEPVAAYQILERKGELPEEKMQVLALYNQGMEHYLKFDEDKDPQHFSDALAFFEQALEIDPTDGPSELYQDRCEDWAENPPEDLVFRATSK